MSAIARVRNQPQHSSRRIRGAIHIEGEGDDADFDNLIFARIEARGLGVENDAP